MGSETMSVAQSRLHRMPSIAALVLIPIICIQLHAAAQRTAATRPADGDWGETKNGLRTRLTAAKAIFPAGHPIPMKLEMENVADAARAYHTPAVPINNTLIVLDERGEKVPYIGGLAQVQVRPETIDPAQKRELKSFDLAEWYYLRRPGRYIVKWPGMGVFGPKDLSDLPDTPIPASAEFRFDVIADPAANADGDPVGRLLPLVKNKWWLAAAAKPGKLRPGNNRAEVTGRFIALEYSPTGYKNDSGLVWLWLTDNPAAEQPASGDWPPPSESLGKVARWHLYIHISENAAKAWPTAKDDIKRALETDAIRPSAK